MILLCFTTCSSLEEARKIAKELLAKRLIACANIIPKIESHYLWKERLEKGNEALLALKTKRELQGNVEEEIKRLHSYKLPAIEFVEASAGKEVREWVEGETK